MKIKKQKGFTLIELVVIMAIIGILVTIGAPRLMGRTQQASLTKLQADAKVIEDALHRDYSESKEWKIYTNAPLIAADVNSFGEEIYDTNGNKVTLNDGIYYNINIEELKENAKLQTEGYYYVFDKEKGKVYAIYKPIGERKSTYDDVISAPPGTNLGYPVQLVGSYESRLFLTPTNQVYAWGANWDGELGVGLDPYVDWRVEEMPTPTKIEELGAVKIDKITGEDYHHFALTTDGRLFAWGLNFTGQCGIDTIIKTRLISPQEITNIFDGEKITKAYAAGYENSFVVTEETPLYAWGLNYNGSLGLGHSDDVYNPIAITDQYGEIDFTTQEIKYIDSGGKFTVFVTNDNKIYSAGYERYDVLGYDNAGSDQHTPKEITSPLFAGKEITNLSVGRRHTVITTADNEMYSWGSNSYGELGIGGTTTSITPTHVSSMSGKEIKFLESNADSFFTVAVTSNNEIYTWGDNGDGQLGFGDYSQRNTPTLLDDPLLVGKNIEDISTTYASVLLITDEHEFYGWGENYPGLTDGADPYETDIWNYTSPVKVTTIPIE